ncbi:MAG: hypothetical protein ALECFALPRED_004467 [Alectoria fallacina]|uniref:FAD-binding domain-containing protein n=1 Tax=Alectoria fallacina TaxID=1903189 RepID=A0A8H3FVI3_9LECA|nr:MAG: hypothetical protein ALECFALPRED_004467 [Alectoria fallacina]
MSMPPITIADAGLAGLTLGRCLKQKGIPSILLERVSSSPRYNYGITLHPWAYQPLLNVLQMDESSFRERLSIDASRGGMGSISADRLLTGVDTTPGTFRCHRGRLEQFLQEDQDIRWEHTIKEIETTPQKVIVRIQNEQAIESDVLIGTDGVHSQVRKSLAPDIQLKVLPFVVFNGKRRMSLDSFQNTIAPQMQSLSIIQCRREDVALQIAVNQYTATYIDVEYTYSRPARQNDPLHKPDRPILGATDIPEEFYAELQELEDLGQAYKEMFDVTKVREDRILHFLMRSTLGTEQEIKDLADRGVLLVGDAVHAMPLLGGEGGNNAMKDGVDLAEHIAAHGPQGIKTFSSARYERWRKGVEQSEQRLAEIHSPAKASL